MAWSTPTVPVSGTVITVAWATSSVVDPINWLRTLTGGADPPASNRVVYSTSPTATTWGQLPTDTIANAAITDAKMALLKVNAVNPLNSLNFANVTDGSGFFDVSATSDSPAGGGAWHLFQSQNRLAPSSDYRCQIAMSILDQNEVYIRAIIAGAFGTWRKLWHAGNDGAGSGQDADLLDGVQGAGYAPIANQVPSGLIAAFATAAAIASGWARCTGAGGTPNLDGRMLVGAGTTFSVTYVENTAYGSSWAHATGIGTLAVGGTTDANIATSTVQSGTGASVASAGHAHTVAAASVTGAPASATWVIPSHAVVWAQKT